MTDRKNSGTDRQDDGTLPLVPDHLIGNYRLVRRIGSGSMGDVYLARHREFKDRLSAIKLISPGVISDEARGRFKQEIQAMGKMVHPNLVHAHDAGMEGDRMYLVMEYVSGSDLQCLIDQHGPFRVPFAAEIIRQICQGVSHAHQRSVIHRDIKPANVLLSDDMKVKVMDLGIASLQSEATARMTQDMSLMGTGAFIAPELWVSAKNATSCSDVYAIGCTAYCLLTGDPPFAGEKYESIHQLMNAHRESQPTPLPTIRQDIPAGLSRILKRSLHKNPAKRFQDTREFAAELAPFCSPLPSEIPKLFGVSDHVEEPKPPTKSAATKSGRGKLVLMTTLFTALIAIALGIYSLSFYPDPPDPLPTEHTWIPDGYEALPTATLVTVRSPGNDNRFWSQIRPKDADTNLNYDLAKITFNLVPHCGTNSPRSFYIMKDKVPARLFNAFEDAYPSDVDTTARDKRAEQRRVKNPDEEDPAYWVTGKEVTEFSKLVFGGMLPTPEHWDATFGFTFKAVELKECISSRDPSYTDFVLSGPNERDAEHLGESRWGCVNMFSKGREYTRFDPETDYPDPDADPVRWPERKLRGGADVGPEEWASEELMDWYDRSPEDFEIGTKAINQFEPDIGFRVMLEHRQVTDAL